MGCARIITSPRTLGQTLRDAGFAAREDATPKQLNEVIDPGGKAAFICGAGIKPGEDVCVCGRLSGFLCDWPVGGGKTCDLPLCSDCARVIGEDRHACEIHWHCWHKDAGSVYVRQPGNGPRIVR